MARATGYTKVMNFASNISSWRFSWRWKRCVCGGLAHGAGQWLGARSGSRMVIARGTRFVRPVFLSMCLPSLSSSSSTRFTRDRWRVELRFGADFEFKQACTIPSIGFEQADFLILVSGVVFRFHPATLPQPSERQRKRAGHVQAVDPLLRCERFIPRASQAHFPGGSNVLLQREVVWALALGSVNSVLPIQPLAAVAEDNGFNSTLLSHQDRPDRVAALFDLNSFGHGVGFDVLDLTLSALRRTDIACQTVPPHSRMDCRRVGNRA